MSYGRKVFEIVEFLITCNDTGSEIKCFVTDDPGKAEGRHPFDEPGAEMAVIINEAKSITDEMFQAFSRFTGYNYWLEISSPGKNSGHFFKRCTKAKYTFPDKLEIGEFYWRRVTAFDCPHLLGKHIEHLKDEHGEQSLIYRSQVLAEFTSLYPSIIRSLNIGIETLIGRIVNRDKYDNQWSLKELKLLNPEMDITIERINANRGVVRSTVKVGKIIELIEQENWIISAPGVIFSKTKESVVCEILTDWFNKRSEYKKLMKDAFKVKKDPVLGDFYNRRQHAYKIKLNDVYGVFAINGWRYTDGHKMISSAITLTGQRVTQESIKFVNEWMNKELGTKDKDYIVTSDTDSLFIQTKELILQRDPELANGTQDEIVKAVLTVATEIQKLANDNLHTLVQELFNVKYPDEPHYFELKQEVVLDRGYFAGKRRYAML